MTTTTPERSATRSTAARGSASRAASRHAPTIWRSAEEGIELHLRHDPAGVRAWVVDRLTVVAARAPERWWYRGEWHEADAGTLRLLEPGEVVQLASEADGWRALLHIETDRLFAGASGTAPRVLGFRRCVTDELRLPAARLLSTVTDASAAALAAAAFAVTAMLVPSELRFATAPPGAPLGVCRDPVTLARSLLLEVWHRAVSLEELSRASGLSRYHLARRFSEEVGMPPHLFHLHVRLGHARRLLAAGADASSAAHETGFSDQAHLTRWFTRLHGVSPGQYRRALQLSQ